MKIGGLAVADGDHEVRPGKDVYFSELDRLGLVDITSRAQDAEQRGAVPLELGALVCVHGVLDGELVKVELAGDVGELRVGRAVETDPDGPAALATESCHLRDVRRVDGSDPFAVDGTIDDHRENLLLMAALAPRGLSPRPRSVKPRITSASRPCRRTRLRGGCPASRRPRGARMCSRPWRDPPGTRRADDHGGARGDGSPQGVHDGRRDVPALSRRRRGRRIRFALDAQ